MTAALDDRLRRVPRLVADLRERADVWREAKDSAGHLVQFRPGDPLLDEAADTLEQLAAELDGPHQGDAA